MNHSGNTVLITGGASGIGLALAERFMLAGNEVIICGRREDKLKEAQQKFPKLHIRICDVSKAADRESLHEWVTMNVPEMNILVNNAGIQQRVNLLKVNKNWEYYGQELAINVDGPIHLSMLFVPHLIQKSSAAIVNVTSGLAITPATWVPIYSATKAALHSFTMTLRLQLANTNVKVIEILPPAVNTDLGGVGLHTFGAPLDDFADTVYKEFENGELEIGYGGTEKRLRASKEENDQATKFMWENFIRNNPEF